MAQWTDSGHLSVKSLSLSLFQFYTIIIWKFYSSPGVCHGHAFSLTSKTTACRLCFFFLFCHLIGMEEENFTRFNEHQLNCYLLLSRYTRIPDATLYSTYCSYSSIMLRAHISLRRTQNGTVFQWADKEREYTTQQRITSHHNLPTEPFHIWRFFSSRLVFDVPFSLCARFHMHRCVCHIWKSILCMWHFVWCLYLCRVCVC